jgi:hypothetical protein
MTVARIIGACTVLAGLATVAAHGGLAHQKPLSVDPDADWATRHMAGLSSISILKSQY